MDRDLWRVENYLGFLEERKRLLARATNDFLEELLHGPVAEEDLAPLDSPSLADFTTASDQLTQLGGGIESDEEEEAVLAINDWIAAQGLPQGQLTFELADEKTGAPMAILDLAWPQGLQEEYSQPVALLIDEGPELLALANARGFRYFTSVEDLKRYVQQEVLTLEMEMTAD